MINVAIIFNKIHVSYNFSFTVRFMIGKYLIIAKKNFYIKHAFISLSIYLYISLNISRKTGIPDSKPIEIDPMENIIEIKVTSNSFAPIKVSVSIMNS